MVCVRKGERGGRARHPARPFGGKPIRPEAISTVASWGVLCRRRRRRRTFRKSEDSLYLARLQASFLVTRMVYLQRECQSKNGVQNRRFSPGWSGSKFFKLLEIKDLGNCVDFDFLATRNPGRCEEI